MKEPITLEELAAALEEVQERVPDPAVQGIIWIRVKHPLDRMQERILRDGRRGGKACAAAEFLLFPLRWAVCFAYAVILFLRTGLLRFRLGEALRRMRDKSFPLVAKSWSYSPTQVTQGKDFYWGDLGQRTEEAGAPLLHLSGNANGMEWRDFFRARVSEEMPSQIPEMALVPPAAPFRAAFLQGLTSLRLLWLAWTVRDPLVARVAALAGRDALAPRATPILLYYWIGKTAGAWWRPKALISLYEGYGWERLLFRGVKEGYPACRTVGYQHTILLRHNLALLRERHASAGAAAPEVVLCLGPRTRALLEPSHPRSILVPFGTFRTTGRPADGVAPDPRRRTVLVLPEGYLEEARLLFRAAVRVARLLPDHRFLLRSHPVLPFEKVAPFLDPTWKELRNLTQSTAKELETDLRDSSAVLYRGSSSVLWGILQGLKPFYWQEGAWDIDPLFELPEGWRQRVCSAEELAQGLQAYASTQGAQRQAGWAEAAEYVRSYATPVGRESIERLLASAGISERESQRCIA